MAQVAIALVTMHFGSAHEETSVFGFADHFCVKRLIKGRPAGPAIEFVCLIKKRSAAAFAYVGPRCFGEVIVGEGALLVFVSLAQILCQGWVSRI